jgi:alpha-beta hydrolase superfamily lysophospholipase
VRAGWREGTALGSRETPLRWRFLGPEPSWGSVFLIHGLGEHSGRYEALTGRLVASGLSVFSFDLRGHGLSGGDRGDIESFDDFLQDVACMRGVWEEECLPGGRRFLLGHSLGGLIALRHLQVGGSACDGVILSAPWLRAAQPGWLRVVGRGLGTLLPGLRLPNGLGAHRLTRDPEMALAWQTDPHIHTRLTGRLFREAEGVQGAVLGGWGGNRCPPLLFLVPEEDPVVNSRVTIEFARGFAEGDVQVEILRERRHEAFNDLGREEVFDLVVSFLTKWKP